MDTYAPKLQSLILSICARSSLKKLQTNFDSYRAKTEKKNPALQREAKLKAISREKEKKELEKKKSEALAALSGTDSNEPVDQNNPNSPNNPDNSNKLDNP